MNLTAGQKLYAALEIDTRLVPLDRLNAYNAIAYFLTVEDEPPEQAKNLERVDRYLQAFHHLCEMSEWQKAGQILSFCPISKELHDQLRIWGYYREQIGLYQDLLGKVSPEQDLVCLNGLGRAFYNLSDFDKSWGYYQQQLQLSRQVNNRKTEAQAIGGLGDIQHMRQNYSEAIALFQQQLDIARKIGDRKQEGYALTSLGCALYNFGLTRNKQNYHQNGLNYLQESLGIAQELQDPEMESFCLTNVRRAYFDRGQYDQVLIFIQQQLDICDKTNDKRGRYFALEDLGQCYSMLRKYDQALCYAKEALSIVREFGDKFYESCTLNNLGVIYCYKLHRYQEALSYFEKSLEILQKTDSQERIALIVVNIFNCHCFLKNKEQSDFYLNRAKLFMAKSDSLEDKGLVTMAIANAYWGRNEFWYKAWGIVLVIKGLLMMPPWRSVNGRLAMEVTIKQIFGLAN
ncbi:tetratricopeptide repeat protein [Pseudanabaena sp. Chao 1811]|uniref:tetratricopeptide repeat protein n=1 Tax=Pseudanabaena sp. Chao 1811 TaxID=2963092 RepID=UPI0022F3AEB9|nr:tetratricopeptide repeat protein [Pseudanabaena sp. Chao 1811]